MCLKAAFTAFTTAATGCRTTLRYFKDSGFRDARKCADAVEFEPIMLAALTPDRRGRIVLYELPVFEHESDQQKFA